jgi:hypothetical protein
LKKRCQNSTLLRPAILTTSGSNRRGGKISQWCEPAKHTCLLRALTCKEGCGS